MPDSKLSSTLSVEDEYVQHSVVAVFELMKKELIQGMENTEKFKKIKEHFDKRTNNLKSQATKV